MQKLTLLLCVTVAAAAPWPFSMWRASSELEVPRSMPTFYHTTDQMENEATQLQGKCEGLTVETVSDGKHHIQVAKYKAPGSSTQYKTMVVAGEHAREMIGSEIALNFVQALCGQAAADDIEAAKKDTEFLVVINANPVSRTAVEKGDFCKRVNENAVDINRNFDINWDTAERGLGDTNPGKHAFDQPESRILKKLMETFKPHAYLDLHSGFRGMFFPNAVANDPELATKLQRLSAPIDEAACQCPLGTANKEVGYHTAGSALDYSFSVLKVPFAMAMEVYLPDEETGEIAQLEARWKQQKGELLRPIATKSSFMRYADKVLPLKLIQSGDSKEIHGQTPDWCLNYFNPIEQSVYEKTVKTWTSALAQLSIKSREVPANAATFAMQKSPALKFKEIAQDLPEEFSPVWFALKCLGLLLIIYVGIKYYKVRQAKSPEQVPLSTQMTPIQTLQVSD